MRSRTFSLFALILAIALFSVACSSDEAPEDAAPVAETEPSPEPDPTCPLTGETPKDVSVLERPGVAVKIENSPSARPQAGLEDADLVFEEIVEGGITRFLAVFHCTSTGKAGPVRSARFDDPKIALPFTSVLAYSGANKIVERELTDQGLTILHEDTAGTGLFRDPPGSLDVHSLYADVDQLLKTARKAKTDLPNADAFKFGDIEGKAKKAKSLSINFHSSNTIEYRWEGDAWKRYEAGTAFMTESGSQIAVPNVLVMEVDVNNSQTIVDVAGNPSPDIDLLSGGKALLFRDGQVIKGSWKVPDVGSAPEFTAKGGELTFAEGPIWIELVPSKKGTVKGSFSFSKK